MRRTALVPARVRAFFASEAEAPDLAVLRIVVFGWLVALLATEDFSVFARYPAELRVAPPGWAGVFDALPWDERSVSAIQGLARAACVAGLVGLYSRTASLVACACLVYLLGLPEFFGKVDHVNHHFVWLTAILAASRSGDALAIDAVRSALRRADRGGGTAPPPASTAYALPLRLTWLLIGVAYVFPGLAKLASGPEWVLGDNIRNLLHRYWMTRDFVPAVRIDRYPLAYRSAAAATVLFEVGFLPALFFPRLRRPMVAGGVAFHLLNAFYLRISFYGLLVAYAAFVPWTQLLEGAARRLFPGRPVLVYDGRRRESRRLVAALRALDVLRAVDWWDQAERGPLVSGVTPAPLVRTAEIAVALPAGAPARRPRLVLLARLPLALPLLPVLRAIARRPARRDATRVSGADRPATAAAAAVVGALLLTANVVCGLLVIDSWPFSVYPRFAGIAGPAYTAVEVEVRDPAGRTRPVDTGLRPLALLRLLDATGRDRTERLAALQEHLVRSRVALGPGESLEVVETTRSVRPEDRGRPPLRRRVLWRRDT